MENENPMEKYLFRASPGYEPGQKIICKNPDFKDDIIKSMIDHILHGTNVETRFISCTKSMGVTNSYSFGQASNKQESILNNKRSPIVLIDKSKIGKELFDTTEGENARLLFKESINNEDLLDWILSSQEVLAEYEIPANAIKQIPPIFADLIRAYEICKYNNENSENNVQQEHMRTYNHLMQFICDGIMDGKIDNDFISKMFSEVKLSWIEGFFINNFYGKNPKTIGQMLDIMCRNDDEFSDNAESTYIFNAIRTNLIRKIGESKTLRKYFYDAAAEKYQNGQIKIGDAAGIAKCLSQEQILEDYIEFYDGKYMHRTTSYSNQKLKKEILKENNIEHKSYKDDNEKQYVIGGCTGIKLNLDKTKRYPFSIQEVQCKMNNNMNYVISVSNAEIRAEKDNSRTIYTFKKLPSTTNHKACVIRKSIENPEKENNIEIEDLDEI